jgi:hypothetical protein
LFNKSFYGVWDVREKECNYANISREECNNFIHVLRYVGAVDNKTRFVGGPSFWPSLPSNAQIIVKYLYYVVFIRNNKYTIFLVSNYKNINQF